MTDDKNTENSCALQFQMRLKDLLKNLKTLNSSRLFILLRSRALIFRSTKYNRLQQKLQYM